VQVGQEREKKQGSCNDGNYARDPEPSGPGEKMIGGTLAR
jgi:hypothetical protein